MIYLDNAATTPVDPQVVQAMLPVLTGPGGNPSSHYSIGYEAKEQIDTARAQQLQTSLSDRSSLQDIYEDNMQLIQQVGQLEEQVKQLEEDKQSLTSQLSDQEKASQAMDWFWQIDEAYVLGRYSLCRELIQEIQDAGLVDYLPKESITDNGRFSPSGRYQEIYEALY